MILSCEFDSLPLLGIGADKRDGTDSLSVETHVLPSSGRASTTLVRID